MGFSFFFFSFFSCFFFFFTTPRKYSHKNNKNGTVEGKSFRVGVGCRVKIKAKAQAGRTDGLFAFYSYIDPVHGSVRTWVVVVSTAGQMSSTTEGN